MKKLTSWKNKTAKKAHLESLINNSRKEALDYDMSKNLEVGDYIKHEKFGLGFIQKVINLSKVEVFFEGSEKVMLQNWKRS